MSESVVDKARRIRLAEIASMPQVPEADVLGRGTLIAIEAYKATSDIGEGDLEDDEIEVKHVKSDGEVIGNAKVWKVLPA